MELDDIISYHDLVSEEKAALQKGMSFGAHKSRVLTPFSEACPIELLSQSEVRNVYRSA